MIWTGETRQAFEPRGATRELGKPGYASHLSTLWNRGDDGSHPWGASEPPSHAPLLVGR